MQNISRRRWPLAVALAGAATLAACSDSRIGDLSPGITRDSLMTILAQGGQAGDTLPHVYRAEKYLSKGQMLEVLFYDRGDANEGTETVPEGDLTPIVLRSDTLLGWGWTYYDSLAKDHNLTVKPR
jgi:hypothetical protein